jgi:hypothetical protein
MSLFEQINAKLCRIVNPQCLSLMILDKKSKLDNRNGK